MLSNVLFCLLIVMVSNVTSVAELSIYFGNGSNMQEDIFARRKGHFFTGHFCTKGYFCTRVKITSQIKTKKKVIKNKEK